MALLDSKVSDNWGIALANIAVENKKENEFIEQTGVLIDLLKNNQNLVDLLSIKIDTNSIDIDKDKIIDDVFTKAGFNPYIVNAMKLLAAASEFEYARDVFKKTRRILSLKAGNEYGVIWSTEPISDAQVKQFEEKIGKKLNKNIKLVNKIDQSLIGGVEIVVEGRIFDGSVKGKLDHIRYQILENQNKKTEKEVD
ncbi:F0F1 ATP synthase subunit delta [Mesoplasma lactucae]|uniref:ATP synthase subunit delta n=1 Tax=Mesoplasma lactucae ATCC 49193 TaxID=81460 RepID=A0A291IS16_9MOLU|nr:F0F1 ATP synthase subunit delta [Mesoplasma lactucae]ATG97652.1 ATP synthase F1 subunit delta [Mesoplasma lactucae ATCC 49193]ATZ19885.1 F0F1 ATP synthase subunit delta [Mesoplasma lactucae ATCC 49193]MCL8216748.1 ATP synthase subunit delta [Mesoplasma lactucae ATCC 49193]